MRGRRKGGRRLSGGEGKGGSGEKKGQEKGGRKKQHRKEKKGKKKEKAIPVACKAGKKKRGIADSLRLGKEGRTPEIQGIERPPSCGKTSLRAPSNQ